VASSQMPAQLLGQFPWPDIEHGGAHHTASAPSQVYRDDWPVGPNPAHISPTRSAHARAGSGGVDEAVGIEDEPSAPADQPKQADDQQRQGQNPQQRQHDSDADNNSPPRVGGSQHAGSDDAQPEEHGANTDPAKSNAGGHPVYHRVQVVFVRRAAHSSSVADEGAFALHFRPWWAWLQRIRSGAPPLRR
jgi:hypothetical protein